MSGEGESKREDAVRGRWTVMERERMREVRERRIE